MQYDEFTKNLNSTWRDVQSKLKDNDVAVEFVLREAANYHLLYAITLRKKFNHPHIVYLCQCDTLLKDFKGGSNIKDYYPYMDIWNPIIKDAEVNTGDNIYFAPDGILTQLPIESFDLADGQVMSDMYNLRRVSSTRELCYREDRPTYKNATLYGGLQYDLDENTMLAESKIYSTTATRGVDEAEVNLLSNIDETTRRGISYLPATLTEVNTIADILKENSESVVEYTEARGNEESFKAMSGKAPNILHLATHGLYIKKTEAEKQSQENQRQLQGIDNNMANVIDFSMSRTSLVLSGAKQALNHQTIPEGVEDGILTAKEIAGLDLRNVDLAVLSACETGLGDITSDGVAGLQRGFKNAGVKSLLMSLWKVSDNATQLLMTEFYKNLMSGKTKAESLRNAQNFVRNYEKDGEKIFASPRYWASFILLDGLN